MILGQGSFGVVFGPVAFRQVQPHFRGLKLTLPGDATYVVKFYTEPVGSDELDAIARKQALYDKLRAQMPHDSVIMPLATYIFTGEYIKRMLPVLARRFQSGQKYQVELQQYGGISIEKVLVDDRDKRVMTMTQFSAVWRSVSDILEDCCHLLMDNDLIMTDVKMENIVLSQDDWRMRLIDADLNPNAKTRRITTTYILNMPPQYLSEQWWLQPASREKAAQRYQRGYVDVLSRADDKELHKVLKYIHGGRHPFAFARVGKLSPDENKFQRMFFIIYPIFLIVIQFVVKGLVRARTRDDVDSLRRIVAFCLGVLRKRGHFAAEFNNLTFQRFLSQMRSI